ncbi:hypothetical protein ACOCEA_07765 [Maribacter sp. CXY002]|uniref:hypothetical protein n=1 Tax=Maribacter luteocoastalis TaxID=3407671 RepID=UPI003B682D56
MKKKVLVLAVLFSAWMNAQDQYTKGMQKAFELWGQGKPVAASNLFERISSVELDNWLPYYYVAQVNTVMSFDEKDEARLKQQLDKAREFLELAKVISPDNPEILVQEAMMHTAWIIFDGATYGMTLSGKVAALYAKAIKLGPKNPRVVFSKAEWDMGAARYFGQDLAPYCKDVERSLELFANFKPESHFHPNWGVERAMETFEKCKG